MPQVRVFLWNQLELKYSPSKEIGVGPLRPPFHKFFIIHHRNFFFVIKNFLITIKQKCQESNLNQVSPLKVRNTHPAFSCDLHFSSDLINNVCALYIYCLKING